MFERFTDRARRVVVLAQELARMDGQSEIDCGYLLLGIFEEKESAAVKVLDRLGIKQGDIPRDAAPTPAPAGHIPFTNAVKKAMELGLREALQHGVNYVAPEHLLLGLARGGSIEEFIGDHQTVKTATMEVLAGEIPPRVPQRSGVQGVVVEANFKPELEPIGLYGVDSDWITVTIALPPRTRIGRGFVDLHGSAIQGGQL